MVSGILSQNSDTGSSFFSWLTPTILPPPVVVTPIYTASVLPQDNPATLPVLSAPVAATGTALDGTSAPVATASTVLSGILASVTSAVTGTASGTAAATTTGTNWSSLIVWAVVIWAGWKILKAVL